MYQVTIWFLIIAVIVLTVCVFWEEPAPWKALKASWRWFLLDIKYWRACRQADRKQRRRMRR